MTEIVELKDFIPAYTNAVQKLLEQLTNRPVKLTETTLKEIISQENTHLFFLLADQEICGNADCEHLSQPHRRQSVD